MIVHALLGTDAGDDSSESLLSIHNTETGAYRALDEARHAKVNAGTAWEEPAWSRLRVAPIEVQP